MVGLPLLLLVSSVVDVNRAQSKNANVRAAIDAAALASVIPDNMSNDERYAYAQTIFDQNYFGREAVSLNVTGGRERVDIVATTRVPTTISGMLGIDYVSVKQETAAVLTRSDIVCLLALDPEGDRSLEFSNQSVFNSPACSVQVNSTSPFAMVSGVVIPPLASSFCVSGISQGVFLPFVKHSYSPVVDPYAGLVPPADGPCVDIKTLKGHNKTIQSYDDLIEGLDAVTDVVGDNGVLVAGTYCNGLKIEGINVNFLPGTYIIKKHGLEVKKYAGAMGIDVTIVLKGVKSKLKIKDNSKVYLKASATGPYAGLVFYQTVVDDKKKMDLGKKPKKKMTKLKKVRLFQVVGLLLLAQPIFPLKNLKLRA